MNQGVHRLVKEVCQLWCCFCDVMVILKAHLLAVIIKWAGVRVCSWALNPTRDQINNFLSGLTDCSSHHSGEKFSASLVQSSARMNKISVNIFGSSLPGPHCGCTSNICERVPYFFWVPHTQQEAGEMFARQMLSDGPASNSSVTSHLYGNDTTIIILELHPTLASASRRYRLPDGRNPTQNQNGLNCSFC